MQAAFQAGFFSILAALAYKCTVQPVLKHHQLKISTAWGTPSCSTASKMYIKELPSKPRQAVATSKVNYFNDVLL